MLPHALQTIDGADPCGPRAFVGAGTSERGGIPTRISYVVSLVPSPVNAFCVTDVGRCPESESCDDRNACTIDTPSDGGCASRPAENGTACTIGDLSGQCDAGKCILQGLVCPVVSQYTNPVSVGGSCRYVATPDGTACASRSGARGSASRGTASRGNAPTNSTASSTPCAVSTTDA